MTMARLPWPTSAVYGSMEPKRTTCSAGLMRKAWDSCEFRPNPTEASSENSIGACCIVMPVMRPCSCETVSVDVCFFSACFVQRSMRIANVAGQLAGERRIPPDGGLGS